MVNSDFEVEIPNVQFNDAEERAWLRQIGKGRYCCQTRYEHNTGGQYLVSCQSASIHILLLECLKPDELVLFGARKWMIRYLSMTRCDVIRNGSSTNLNVSPAYSRQNLSEWKVQLIGNKR